MSIEFTEVQIGRGLRPLAQHGFVVVDDAGVLSLLGSDRSPIASAPLAQVSASYVRFTRRQTLSMLVAGERFNVSPQWGATGPFRLPGLQDEVRDAAEALLTLVEAGRSATD